jgi:hypothetical protein
VREGLADILERLPKRFYHRLLRVAAVTGDPPERVLDRALRGEEIQAGLVTDKEFRRQVVAEFMSDVARQTAETMGEVGRLVRSRRAAEGRRAKEAGVDLKEWLEEKAKAHKMTVKQYLERPREDK